MFDELLCHGDIPSLVPQTGPAHAPLGPWVWVWCQAGQPDHRAAGGPGRAWGGQGRLCLHPQWPFLGTVVRQRNATYLPPLVGRLQEQGVDHGDGVGLDLLVCAGRCRQHEKSRRYACVRAWSSLWSPLPERGERKAGPETQGHWERTSISTRLETVVRGQLRLERRSLLTTAIAQQTHTARGDHPESTGGQLASPSSSAGRKACTQPSWHL